MKSYDVTIQMKATEQYFHMVLLVFSILQIEIWVFHAIKWHLGKVKLELMQPAVFPIDKAMTCGVASKGFAGFQGSLLYKCSVIS